MTTTHSFSTRYDKRVSVLITEIHLTHAFDPEKTSPYPPLKPFSAIWDTGATNSVITQKVIDECDLKPTGMTMVHGVEREYKTETFLVNILLPNKVGFREVRVTKGELPGTEEVLIGMDIINQGDFAITHKDDKTLFSFRWPSVGHIDFVAETKIKLKVGRNDPCSCGSGKKYKKCCG